MAVAGTPMPAAAAERCQEHRLGEELAADVVARGTERPAPADLAAALQDRDHHDVRHADGSGQQGDRGQGHEQAGAWP